jgi:hypothetical protein
MWLLALPFRRCWRLISECGVSTQTDRQFYILPRMCGYLRVAATFASVALRISAAFSGVTVSPSFVT